MVTVVTVVVVTEPSGFVIVVVVVTVLEGWLADNCALTFWLFLEPDAPILCSSVLPVFCEKILVKSELGFKERQQIYSYYQLLGF